MSTPPPPDADHGLRALERLRERIEQAAAAIEHLRAENTRLAARVDELSALDLESRVQGVTIEGDPDALREQVDEFIAALDRMLAEPPTDGAADGGMNGSAD